MFDQQAATLKIRQVGKLKRIYIDFIKVTFLLTDVSISV